MSSLGFCNLDEAFNTSSKLKKKVRVDIIKLMIKLMII